MHFNDIQLGMVIWPDGRSPLYQRNQRLLSANKNIIGNIGISHVEQGHWGHFIISPVYNTVVGFANAGSTGLRSDKEQ